MHRSEVLGEASASSWWFVPIGAALVGLGALAGGLIWRLVGLSL